MYFNERLQHIFFHCVCGFVLLYSILMRKCAACYVNLGWLNKNNGKQKPQLQPSQSRTFVLFDVITIHKHFLVIGLNIDNSKKNRSFWMSCVDAVAASVARL